MRTFIVEADGGAGGARVGNAAASGHVRCCRPIAGDYRRVDDQSVRLYLGKSVRGTVSPRGTAGGIEGLGGGTPYMYVSPRTGHTIATPVVLCALSLTSSASTTWLQTSAR